MVGRQFVNMVVHEFGTRIYTLCRINISQHLFHPSTAAAQEAAARVAKKAKKNKQGWPSTISSCKRLPGPVINFSSPSDVAGISTMHFFSLLRGQGENCIMFTDPHGNTTVYDDDMQSVIAMPNTNFCKPMDSISLSVTKPGHARYSRRDEHCLYVISNNINGFFEVFNYIKTGVSDYPPDDDGWYWCPLPPLLRDPPHSPSAAAVVDHTTICASMGRGTYTFDMVRGLWSEAGDWVLPFHGAAEYVPELSLWFGLEAAGSPHHRLCAFDLSSSERWPPAVQHAWDYLDYLPDEWLPVQRHLLNLGSGRFCIATLCRPVKQHTTCTRGGYSDEEVTDVIDEEVAVLTGVEVVHGDDGLLQMIKHKSRRYCFENLGIHSVL